MTDDLQVELEEDVADGVEFVEYESDRVYSRYNKCETGSKELVHYTNTLACLLTLTPCNIFPHISCLYSPHI